jgi:hypothetical protein
MAMRAQTNASRRRRGFGYERDTETGKAVWLEERGAVIQSGKKSGREWLGVARHLDENDSVWQAWRRRSTEHWCARRQSGWERTREWPEVIENEGN